MKILLAREELMKERQLLDIGLYLNVLYVFRITSQERIHENLGVSFLWVFPYFKWATINVKLTRPILYRGNGWGHGTFECFH